MASRDRTDGGYRSPVRKSKSIKKEEAYCASPVKDLRSLCKERGLKSSGDKYFVIKRLIEDDDVIYEHADAAERAAAAVTEKISSFRRNVYILAGIVVAIILWKMFDRSEHLMAHHATNIPVHRGKVIGAKVTAKDLADAYESIKNEYAKLALTQSARWKVLSSHADGSTVSLLKHKTDPTCPYVRMISIMPASVQDVWDFLSLDNWPKTMPKMDPFYTGLTVLGEYKHKGIEMRLARKTLKRVLTFGKRDFTFVSVSDHPRADGAWVSGTVSVVTDQIPRKKGYTRAFQDSIAFYEEMPDDNAGNPRTKLTIVFRIDLNDTREGGAGGFVPMWMYVKTVGKTGMMSVQNMKKQLLLMTAKRGDVGTCKLNWLDKLRNSSKCDS